MSLLRARAPIAFGLSWALVSIAVPACSSQEGALAGDKMMATDGALTRDGRPPTSRAQDGGRSDATNPGHVEDASHDRADATPDAGGGDPDTGERPDALDGGDAGDTGDAHTAPPVAARCVFETLVLRDGEFGHIAQTKNYVYWTEREYSEPSADPAPGLLMRV